MSVLTIGECTACPRKQEQFFPSLRSTHVSEAKEGCAQYRDGDLECLGENEIEGCVEEVHDRLVEARRTVSVEEVEPCFRS